MHDHSVTELPSLRRQKILLILERDGKVMASELSQHFAVSEDTIRRDLAELDHAGLVQRVHGGALPRPKDSGKDYFTRLEETDEVKVRLAQLAAQKVEDGQIVLFDSGSTALQVARSLRADIQITAVTAAPMNSVRANQSAQGRWKYRNITATPGAASRRSTSEPATSMIAASPAPRSALIAIIASTTATSLNSTWTLSHAPGTCPRSWKAICKNWISWPVTIPMANSICTILLLCRRRR